MSTSSYRDERANQSESSDLLENGIESSPGHNEPLEDDEREDYTRSVKIESLSKKSRKRPGQRKKRRGPDEDETDTEPSKVAQSEGNPNFRDIARTFRLQIIAQLTPWWPKSELPKVTFFKYTPQTPSRLMVHALPLSGAIYLIVISVFISHHTLLPAIGNENGTSPEARAVIAIIAKVHEIMMQGSITVTLLAFINNRMRRGFVPFGWLVAPKNVTSISYMWSAEFLAGILGSRAFPKFRSRLWSGFVIVLGVVLASTCGPSSNIAMVQRWVEIPEVPLIERPVLRIGLTPSELFSLNITNTTGNPFLFGQWLQAVPQVDIYDLEKNTTWSHSVFTAGYTRKIDVEGSWRGEFFQATATIPIHQSSKRLWSIRHSVVDARDGKASLSNGQSGILRMRTWGPKTSVQCSANTWTMIHRHRTFEGASSSHYLTENYLGRRIPQFTKNYVNPLYEAGDWITSPPHLPYSILGLFAKVVSETADTRKTLNLANTNPDQFFDHRTRIQILACGIKAVWQPSEYEMRQISNVQVIETKSVSPHNESGEVLIKIEEIWARRLLKPSKVNISLSTPYNELGNSTSFFAKDVRPMPLELMIAAAFAEGISNVVGERSSHLDKLDNINLCPIDFNLAEDNCTRYRYSLSMLGTTSFFWTSANWTDILPTIISISILALYVLFVFVGTWVVPVRTTAWDSAAELVTLALHSRTPSNLANTAAGIEQLDTYKEPVGVRMNQEGKIELVFKNDEGRQGRKFWKIRANKMY